VLENVTYHEQVAREAEAARSAMAASNSMLSYVNHEIRNPLSGLIGSIEFAMDALNQTTEHKTETKVVAFTAKPNHVDQALADLRTAKECGRRLMMITDDVLDVRKIDEGRLDLNPSATTAINVLERALHSTKHTTHKIKDVELVLARPDVDISLWVDELRLMQVVTNLVSNALKFTDRGTVTIGAHRGLQMPPDAVGIPTAWSFEQGGTPDDEFILFYVRDTGQGIKPEGCKRLFKPFSQVHVTSIDADRRRARPRPAGTGLGLFLSRKICRQMGGDMTVCSVEGAGSTFAFCVPTNVKSLGPGTLPPIETKFAGSMPPELNGNGHASSSPSVTPPSVANSSGETVRMGAALTGPGQPPPAAPPYPAAARSGSVLHCLPPISELPPLNSIAVTPGPVLVVDDVSINRSLLRRNLENMLPVRPLALVETDCPVHPPTHHPPATSRTPRGQH